jgi:hypothetical protein
MAKRALMAHLQRSCFVKLAPSRVAGVGVVALADIPRGVDPFEQPNSHLRAPEQVVCVRSSELRALSDAVQTHALNFFAAVDDPDDPSARLRDASGELVYGVNATGFSSDASWYVNHSDSPNLEFSRRGDGEFNGYLTSRRVAAGEELLVCYRSAFPEMYAAFAPAGADGDLASRRAALLDEIRQAEATVARLRSALRALVAECVRC